MQHIGPLPRCRLRRIGVHNDSSSLALGLGRLGVTAGMEWSPTPEVERGLRADPAGDELLHQGSRQVRRYPSRANWLCPKRSNTCTHPAFPPCLPIHPCTEIEPCLSLAWTAWGVTAASACATSHYASSPEIKATRSSMPSCPASSPPSRRSLASRSFAPWSAMIFSSMVSLVTRR